MSEWAEFLPDMLCMHEGGRRFQEIADAVWVSGPHGVKDHPSVDTVRKMLMRKGVYRLHTREKKCWRRERWRMTISMYRNGMTFAQIGKHLKISRERARQVYLRACREMKES